MRRTEKARAVPPVQSIFGRIIVMLTCTTLLVLFALVINRNRIFAQSAACSGNSLINANFSTGGRWQMCWEERPEAGIVLSDIFYTTPNGTTRKVLEEAGLAQIHVPYHDNGARQHQLTETGLGGAALDNLTAQDCPNGSLISNGSKNLLCQTIEDRNYIYKYYTAEKLGQALALHSVSHVGEQTYVVLWRFYDDGTIEPAIATSGQIERFGTNSQYGWDMDGTGRIGIGNVNNYYWRLDFDLANNGSNDRVQEIQINNSGSVKNMTRNYLNSETARQVNPDTKRSWRIVDGSVTNSDGHPISYHLEPLHAGYNYRGPSYEPWTQNDIFFTQDNACEQFVSQNPTAGGCGSDVTDFVNGQSINGADIVMWYGITYHQLPRSEDEPYRNVHWDSFFLVPRDWTATAEITQ